LTGKCRLLSVFHASTLVKPVNLSLTVLFLFTHPFKTSFASEISLSDAKSLSSVISAQAADEPLENAIPQSDLAPRVLFEDFMNPSPLSAIDQPKEAPGAIVNVAQTSATVQMESVTSTGAHYTDPNGTMIFADGKLAFNLPDLAEGIYQVTVYAFGFPQASVTPQFRMLADNKMISGPVEVTNQDWTYRPYTISNVELAGLGHDFRIELPGGYGEVNLYLDKVVFQKTGDLLPPAQRAVIEAEAMTVQGGSYQAANSMLLWSNGSLTSQRQVESGVYDIEVVAFGLEGDGDLPRMRLLAANRLVGDAVAVKNNNWNYQGYTYSGVELEGGATDFVLQFFNDSAARDLWVDKIILRKRGALAYQGSRVISQAEGLAVTGSSFKTATATALWNDGVLRLPLNDIQSGKYAVEFDAFGVPFNGVLPRAQVFVDGVALGLPIEAANNGWNYQHYKTIEIDLKGGDHEVLIKLAPGFSAGNLWLDRVFMRKTGELPAPQSAKVFSLALNSTILNSAALYGPLAAVGLSLKGFLPELTKQFLSLYQDVFDYLVFVPTLAAAERLSSQSSGSAGSNDLGSFSFGVFNDVQGIGGTYDYRTSFGSNAAGEFEDIVYLDSGLFLTGDFRLATSDFSKMENRLLWEHIAAHELHHRFGSVLTSQFGNPLGILGRQLAHWGAFFDADFSPMDGNDWVDNGNGTFTLNHSYVEEAYFHKAATQMPYNDFDLYAMGLLDASEVKVSFVIDNPRYNGLRLRPYIEDGDDPRGGGPLIQVEISPGVWSEPAYLGSQNGVPLTISGTRRTVTLADVLAYEGARSPAFPAVPRNFKPAFVVLTDSNDTSTTIQNQLTKANTLETSLVDYFAQITRGLGSLTLPDIASSYVRSVAANVSSSPGNVSLVQVNSIAAHSAQRIAAPPVLPVHREYLVKDVLRVKRDVKPVRKPFKRKDLSRRFRDALQVRVTA